MKSFWILLKKELLLELRTREVVVPLISLALLLSTLFGLGAQTIFLPETTIAAFVPLFILFTIIFTVTTSLGRSLAGDLKGSALDGVLLTGVDPLVIYLAKVFSAIIFVVLAVVITILVTAMLLGNTMLPLASLLLVFIISSIGITALSTLLSGISSQSGISSLLLPLILIPLLMPLCLATLELSAQIISAGALDTGSWWLTLLSSLDVVYLVLGANLYRFVITD